MTNLNTQMLALGRTAVAAARVLAQTDRATKDDLLGALATYLRTDSNEILAANALDVTQARQRERSAAMIDRLTLDAERIESMACGVEAIGALADPIGSEIAAWDRPNGLRIARVRVPLGVIGMVFESRPNVMADAAALCIKSGNAAVLRGGSDCFHTSKAIHHCVAQALASAPGLAGAVQMVPTTSRDAVGLLLQGLDGAIDIIVPRGGRSLIERVNRDARVPVIGHLEGLCHVYVDGSADEDMACAIVKDAKLRRTGICGAAETLLLDSMASDNLKRAVLATLLDAGCEVRAADSLRHLDARMVSAVEQDWTTEYLALVISAQQVDGVDAAVAHIQRYGSGHTEAIVADNSATAQRFLDRVDSAIVLHNASTQFADGGEFGMGAEIGISTGKLHARGPVGVEQLTSYKYVVRGAGQIRG
ncbi:MAG: glutamate-5-semialdehyde dehydrogenase [Gammaproteobacteria bacterium]